MKHGAASVQEAEARLRRQAELLAAARQEPGVFSFRGRMVDAPLLRHAEQTLRRAGG